MSQSRSPASIFFQALGAQDQITDINCRGKVQQETPMSQVLIGITCALGGVMWVIFHENRSGSC